MAKTLNCPILGTKEYHDNWESSYTTQDSYAGLGYSGTGYTTSILKITVPSFVGISAKLAMQISAIKGDSDGKETVTLKWALCTSDENKAQYCNTALLNSDATRIATGTVTMSGLSATRKAYTFDIPCTTISAGTYYLYLWTDNTTSGNYVQVYYNSSYNSATGHLATLLYDDGVQCYIHNGTDWELYEAYVHNGTDWERYIPDIHDGTG